MKSGLRVAFLLLLVTGTVMVKGSDPSDDPHGNDLSHEAAADRPKRWSGFSLFNTRRDNGPKPTNPTRGDGLGFSRAEALQDPKPSKPAGGNDFGFNLEDALRPGVKPTENPTGGECQGNVIQKLSTVIENQNQQLRLLLQLMARPSSA